MGEIDKTGRFSKSVNRKPALHKIESIRSAEVDGDDNPMSVLTVRRITRLANTPFQCCVKTGLAEKAGLQVGDKIEIQFAQHENRCNVQQSIEGMRYSVVKDFKAWSPDTVSLVEVQQNRAAQEERRKSAMELKPSGLIPQIIP